MEYKVGMECDIDYERLMFIFKEDWLSRCYKKYKVESFSSGTRVTDISMKVIGISLCDIGYLDVECFGNDRHGTKAFEQKTVRKNLFEDCQQISGKR